MISQNDKIQLLLAEQAGRLNDGLNGANVGDSLTLLAKMGWLGYGVPEHLGGTGGVFWDAVEALATVSEQCLTSGFIFWCQRTFIEYLVASQNAWLQSQILPKILRAEASGATGLSNAMKYIDGIEQLRLEANLEEETITLTGFLPWVSNLNPQEFFVAVATQTPTGKSPVVVVPSNALGLKRGEDLQLLGLQASWTSTIHLEQVKLSRDWIITEDAHVFLPKIRPFFLLLQCGLGLGITRRALLEVSQHLQTTNAILSDRLKQAEVNLLSIETTLRELSLLSNFDFKKMRDLFELRIALIRLSVESVWLELEAKGGNAYSKASSTARRLREVAFLPILTPSLVQLERELSRTSKLSLNCS